jgi:Phage capsid-like protein/Cyclic nucleotide-binding domain
MGRTTGKTKGRRHTMSIDAGAQAQNGQLPSSLGTAAARNLATTTKTVPQMQGITSRWLLRMLPWVQVTGGTYRVNRRLTYTVGDGRVEFSQTGAQVRVIPAELGELALLRGFDDEAVLTALADRFVQREFTPGEVLAERGQPADAVFLIAHGRLDKLGDGKYGEQTRLEVLADGSYFGDRALVEDGGTWSWTIKATTAGTALTLSRQAFQEILGSSELLQGQVERFLAGGDKPMNRLGEADVLLASGHDGEPPLPQTFVDYELSPREYDLSVAQTVLRVHSRVADLYNQPMNQVEQQLRLTIEALRERQEHEMINNRDFGLLHNTDFKQRLQTHSGPPTPDDFDELLSRRRGNKLFLAHPRAIAAFGRECNRRGLYPDTVEVQGHHVPAWRGVPIFPCNKIPVTEERTTSILVMRTGEDEQGVVGLHQTGIPDEYQPSLSVRFMGIDEKAVISYLVSAYYSTAVLVPDALGVLENVQVAEVAG